MNYHKRDNAMTYCDELQQQHKVMNHCDEQHQNAISISAVKCNKY